MFNVGLIILHFQLLIVKVWPCNDAAMWIVGRNRKNLQHDFQIFLAYISFSVEIKGQSAPKTYGPKQERESGSSFWLMTCLKKADILSPIFEKITPVFGHLC